MEESDEQHPTFTLDLHPQEALRAHADTKVLHFADARRAFRGFADAARGADFEVGGPPGALITGRPAGWTTANS